MTHERITLSPKERFFPDHSLDLEALESSLENGEKVVLTKKVEGEQVLTYTLKLEEDEKTGFPVINLHVSNGSSSLTGYVSAPFEGTRSYLRKAWYGSDDERKKFEGRGMIQLATALLFIFVYKKHGINTFKDFASGFSPVEAVFGSRPEGKYGMYTFTKTLNSDNKTIVSTIEKA